MGTLAQRLLHWIKTRKQPTRVFRRVLGGAFWGEHGAALLLYSGLAIGLSWPAVRNFTTHLLGDGGDAKHHLWILWHTREWVLGRQPLFSTDLLYYPQGISLLLHGVGPVMGLFALPFWGLGPEAAYNGALLIGLCLTGYCMYLLARGLQMDRGVALFAGIMLQVSPMHLAGLRGHIEKAFVGLPPLVLLTLHRAFTPKRSAGWTVATALTLLLTALHSGQMFVCTVLAVIFFLLINWLSAKRGQHKFLLQRSALLAISILVLVGPLLIAIMRISSDPQYFVEANLESARFSPDLVTFFLPPYYSVIGGGLTNRLISPYAQGSPWPYLAATAVSLLWTGIALGILAWICRPRLARRWLLFALFGVILSFGPYVHAFGKTGFTEYNLPIILPYAFLTALPGLDFMRTPGRMMMVAYVGLIVAASYGLSWLLQRFHKYRYWLLPAATILLLMEAWPNPWPQEALPVLPQFYQQIAHDAGQYGVLDLPFKPTVGITLDWDFVYTSSFYQVYQMTHHKGIAAGYLSRTYRQHPFLDDLRGCTLSPAVGLSNRNPEMCRDVQVKLARLGYRYVVWHRTMFPGSPGQMTAQWFIQAVFGEQPPLVEDARVTVYQVQALSRATEPDPCMRVRVR